MGSERVSDERVAKAIKVGERFSLSPRSPYAQTLDYARDLRDVRAALAASQDRIGELEAVLDKFQAQWPQGDVEALYTGDIEYRTAVKFIVEYAEVVAAALKEPKP